MTLNYEYQNNTTIIFTMSNNPTRFISLPFSSSTFKSRSISGIGNKPCCNCRSSCSPTVPKSRNRHLHLFLDFLGDNFNFQRLFKGKEFTINLYKTFLGARQCQNLTFLEANFSLRINLGQYQPLLGTNSTCQRGGELRRKSPPRVSLPGSRIPLSCPGLTLSNFV